MRVGIVTGASSGIGSEFCRALDEKGLDSIWLVARRSGSLEAVASGLRTPSRVISADLSTPDGVASLVSAVSSEKPEIEFLINCAGYGRFGETCGMDDPEIRGMVSLNCIALSSITAACIPFMPSGSHIVQVCSASAYLPLKDLNVYASSKAYVRSFCDGLRREVAPKGISVLEVSPGWVETDFIRLSMSDHEVPEKVFKHTVTAEQVVAKAMSDLGRKRSVCGGYNKLQVFVCTHFPSVAAWVWDRSLRG